MDDGSVLNFTEKATIVFFSDTLSHQPPVRKQTKLGIEISTPGFEVRRDNRK